MTPPLRCVVGKLVINPFRSFHGIGFAGVWHGRAVNWRQEDTVFVSKLSVKEREIYYAAYEAATQFTQWRSGKEKKTPSIQAVRGKRKRYDA